MQFSLNEILAVIIISQLAVFIVFLISSKNRMLSNKLLAFFLIYQVIFSIPLFEKYLGIPQFLLARLCATFYLLVPPTMYLYVKSFTGKNFRLKKSHFYHTLLFSMVFLSFSIETVLNSYKLSIFNSNFLNTHLFWKFFFSGMYFQFSVYSFFTFIELKKYRKVTLENISPAHAMTVSWLKIVSFGFLFCWVFSAVTTFLVFWVLKNNYEILGFISTFNFFIFFNILFYKAWSKSQLFTGIEEKPKYQFSDLEKDDAELMLKKLITFMRKQKPHLDPEISLKILAERTEIPLRYLSQIINENLHKNFNDFINDYRIEEAKKILSDPDCDKTVLEILYQVGFNSKSVFNTVFRKKTGLTPTEFRESNLVSVC